MWCNLVGRRGPALTPSICGFLCVGSNITMLITCNWIVLAFYLKYWLIMLFYHDRLQTATFSIARGTGGDAVTLGALRARVVAALAALTVVAVVADADADADTAHEQVHVCSGDKPEVGIAVLGAEAMALETDAPIARDNSTTDGHPA